MSAIFLRLYYLKHFEDVYARNFPDDKLWMKALGILSIYVLSRPLLTCIVYGVFLIEVAQTAMTGADFYYWFVDGFGDVARLTTVHISPIDVPFIFAIISLVVQLFFAYRIFTIKRSFWPAVIVIVMVRIEYTGVWSS